MVISGDGPSWEHKRSRKLTNVELVDLSKQVEAARSALGEASRWIAEINKLPGVTAVVSTTMELNVTVRL